MTETETGKMPRSGKVMQGQTLNDVKVNVQHDKL
jgi:hypothetical protein